MIGLGLLLLVAMGKRRSLALMPVLLLYITAYTYQVGAATIQQVREELRKLREELAPVRRLAAEIPSMRREVADLREADSATVRRLSALFLLLDLLRTTELPARLERVPPVKGLHARWEASRERRARAGESPCGRWRSK